VDRHPGLERGIRVLEDHLEVLRQACISAREARQVPAFRTTMPRSSARAEGSCGQGRLAHPDSPTRPGLALDRERDPSTARTEPVCFFTGTGVDREVGLYVRSSRCSQSLFSGGSWGLAQFTARALTHAWECREDIPRAGLRSCTHRGESAPGGKGAARISLDTSAEVRNREELLALGLEPGIERCRPLRIGCWAS